MPPKASRTLIASKAPALAQAAAQDVLPWAIAEAAARAEADAEARVVAAVVDAVVVAIAALVGERKYPFLRKPSELEGFSFGYALPAMDFRQPDCATLR